LVNNIYSDLVFINKKFRDWLNFYLIKCIVFE
jgi:hypothetical protein